MKISFKLFLYLSYRLKIRLSNKIESKIEAGLISSLKLTRNQKFDAKFNFLLFDKNKINTDKLEILGIVFQAFFVRGLTRSLLFSSQAISNSEEVFNLSRFKLICKVFFEHQQVLDRLLVHLTYEFMNSTEFLQCKKLSEVHIANKLLIVEFKNLKRFIVVESRNKKRIMVLKSEEKLQMTEIDRFIIWNSWIFIEFLRYRNLEWLAEPYLIENYPLLYQDAYKFKKVEYLNHELANLTLDSLFEKKGLEASIVFLNAEIWHQRFIYSDNKIINLDATASASQKFVAGCWQFGPGDKNNSGAQLILRPAENLINLSEGILLMGRCDENWYHFLLDTLPRLMFFGNVPKSVPILIRGDLPPTSKEFLKKLTQRKVVEVEVDQTIRVSRLYVCPGRSTIFDSPPPKGLKFVEFSPQVLNLFRKKVIGSLDIDSDQEGTDKITFERKSSTRNILNWTNVHKVLLEFNFLFLSLDLKFFREQVKVFYNTKFVVAPGGAVLANIIFMKPGSKVLVLKSFRNRNLKLWEKLCESFNLEYIEVTGLPTYWGPNFLRRLHSNFYVFPKKLRRILSREI